MGECGCTANRQCYTFPGPNNLLYVLLLDAACPNCDSPAGVSLERYEPGTHGHDYYSSPDHTNGPLPFRQWQDFAGVAIVTGPRQQDFVQSLAPNLVGLDSRELGQNNRLDQCAAEIIAEESYQDCLVAPHLVVTDQPLAAEIPEVAGAGLVGPIPDQHSAPPLEIDSATLARHQELVRQREALEPVNEETVKSWTPAGGQDRIMGEYQQEALALFGAYVRDSVTLRREIIQSVISTQARLRQVSYELDLHKKDVEWLQTHRIQAAIVARRLLRAHQLIADMRLLISAGSTHPIWKQLAEIGQPPTLPEPAKLTATLADLCLQRGYRVRIKKTDDQVPGLDLRVQDGNYEVAMGLTQDEVSSLRAEFDPIPAVLELLGERLQKRRESHDA